MTPEELAKLLAENDELGIDTNKTAIEETPGQRDITIEEFDAKAKQTRPIGKLSVNKICYNLHKYHCPVCGSEAVGGLTSWVRNAGLRGHVEFKCGHYVDGELK